MILIAGLCGCAIYDSKDGPMVTSSPVLEPSSGYPPGFSVSVPVFSMPIQEAGAKLTQYSLVGVVGLPITYEYIFNEKDKENLHVSVVQSLEASGVTVLPGAPATLTAEFEFAGMVKAGHGYAVPLLKGTLTVTSNGTEVHRKFEVLGEKKASVIASKHSGIRIFVAEVHDLLKSTTP
ncbi:MAG TPA: hypothetical protein PLI48_08265 [Gammaproteobacteria bacterium]|nr:hypothetical protein [Gammaproteobacteria bacterium]